MAVLFEKLTSLNGTVKPLLTFLYLIVEHGKEPHFAALHPDKLIGVEHITIARQAGEVTTKLFVLRLF